MGRALSLSPAFFDRIEQLNTLGIALTAERDTDKLLESILLGAKTITNADGGTLYTVDNDSLHFTIMRTDSLAVAYGGSSGKKIALSPIPLHDNKGRPNTKTVAAYAALQGETINIPDVYVATEFDFSGTNAYDREIGYQSQSFLTVPMLNHEDEVIAVLQLINARDRHSGAVTAFSDEDTRLAQSLASQAAVALSHHHLVLDLKNLLEKFIMVIANAIDEKSPYTGGHCRRVPEIVKMMADAIQSVDKGPLAKTHFSDQALYELKIAALLHDCGKIITPIHIVDKATKLETIHDRMNNVALRFEIMKKNAEIEYLKQRCEALPPDLAGEQAWQAKCEMYDEQRVFIEKCNLGSEYMPKTAQAKVKSIGEQSWLRSDGERCSLLTEDELNNLLVPKGTLTSVERKIINNHIVQTIKMLESLPFPKHLARVPEIAGGHHERMDGKGYPKGLKREEMSVQARLMGIADIFEALTATDRPYKKAMPLSQALTIMGKMKLDGHIDPDLFDVFVSERVYLRYAKAFLQPAQIDDIDFDNLPGYCRSD